MITKKSLILSLLISLLSFAVIGPLIYPTSMWVYSLFTPFPVEASIMVGKIMLAPLIITGGLMLGIIPALFTAITHWLFLVVVLYFDKKNQIYSKKRLSILIGILFGLVAGGVQAVIQFNFIFGAENTTSSTAILAGIPIGVPCGIISAVLMHKKLKGVRVAS